MARSRVRGAPRSKSYMSRKATRPSKPHAYRGGSMQKGSLKKKGY